MTNTEKSTKTLKTQTGILWQWLTDFHTVNMQGFTLTFKLVRITARWLLILLPILCFMWGLFTAANMAWQYTKKEMLFPACRVYSSEMYGEYSSLQQSQSVQYVTTGSEKDIALHTAPPRRATAAVQPASTAKLEVTPENVCVAAALEAEQRHGLPAYSLAAVAFKESTNRPFAIGAAGVDRTQKTVAAALKEVRRLQAAGRTNVDVGCFQINLAAHPKAFRTQQAMFNPAAGADYAARMLKARMEHGDSLWRAWASYHNGAAGNLRGEKYANAVNSIRKDMLDGRSIQIAAK